MNTRTNNTEQAKLEARKDLIARLDRAVELAQALERQVKAAMDIVDKHHALPLAA